MHIVKLTWRNKNDFHFIAYCQYCQKTSEWYDGYADSYYQQEVFPNKFCEHCNLNEYGKKQEE